MVSAGKSESAAYRGETVLRPTTGWVWPDLRALWAHRDLVGFLVWRDIKVRYRQTFFGAAWAVVPPFVTMLVFTVVFGMLVGVPSDGLPYWAFSLSALTPWTYFSQAVTAASHSAVDNGSLIEKVYFPRLVLPLAAALAPLLDLAIAFCVLLIAFAIAGILPTGRVLLVLPLTAIAVVAACGLGTFFASVNVIYRDVRHILPLLLQLWLFATPVVFPANLLPEALRLIWGLNPMTGVVEGFRWALLGADTNPWPLVGLSAISASIMLVVGVLVFCRLERRFADVI